MKTFLLLSFLFLSKLALANSYEMIENSAKKGEQKGIAQLATIYATKPGSDVPNLLDVEIEDKYKGDLAQALILYSTLGKRGMKVHDVLFRHQAYLGDIYNKLMNNSNLSAQDAHDLFVLTATNLLPRNADVEESYLKSAKAGSTEAMVELGLIKKKKGDIVLARFWFAKAGDSGFSLGYVQLGYTYEDDSHQNSWLRKAAMMGDSSAMDSYARSRFLKKQYIEALVFMKLALNYCDKEEMTFGGQSMYSVYQQNIETYKLLGDITPEQLKMIDEQVLHFSSEIDNRLSSIKKI